MSAKLIARGHMLSTPVGSVTSRIDRRGFVIIEGHVQRLTDEGPVLSIWDQFADLGNLDRHAPAPRRATSRVHGIEFDPVAFKTAHGHHSAGVAVIPARGPRSVRAHCVEPGIGVGGPVAFDNDTGEPYLAAAHSALRCRIMQALGVGNCALTPAGVLERRGPHSRRCNSAPGQDVSDTGAVV